MGIWWYDGVKFILENKCVTPKIRELISILESAGFENTGGKGSHRNYKHPNLKKRATCKTAESGLIYG